MNWRRGLLRVWLLFSVPWILVFFVQALVTWHYISYDPWAPLEDSPVRIFDSVIPPGQFREVSDAIWPWLAMAVMPPAALLVFGYAFHWVISGFKRDDGREQSIRRKAD